MELLPTAAPEVPRRDGRERVAWTLVGVALTVMVPALFLVPQPIHWTPSDALFALALLSLVLSLAAVNLRWRWSMDCADSPVFIALCIFGPLPAMAIMSLPDIVQWRLERFRPIALAVNLASFGWALVVASLILTLGGAAIGPNVSPSVGDLPVYAVGLVAMLWTNTMLGRALLLLHDGLRWKSFSRELPTMLPCDVFLAFSTAAIVWTYGNFGLASLALVLPQAFLWELIAKQSAKRIYPEAFDAGPVGKRAIAIAEGLDLSDDEIRIVASASSNLDGAPQLHDLKDFPSIMDAILSSKDPWNKQQSDPGQPGKILAVARAWAKLSSNESTPPAEDVSALIALKMKAGSELDPEIVAVAIQAAGHVPAELELRLSAGWGPDQLARLASQPNG